MIETIVMAILPSLTVGILLAIFNRSQQKKATEIAAAVEKQLEKGIKVIKVQAGEKPIDKGYINLDDITDD